MGQHDTTTDVSLGVEGIREIPTSTGTVRIPEITVSDLTVGEHLLLWRRREGYNQREAPYVIGVSRYLYEKLELGVENTPLKEMPHLSDLFSYEICFIMRRRSGWTIPQCAEQAEVSRYWYNLMEQGKANPETLVKYWSEE